MNRENKASAIESFKTDPIPKIVIKNSIPALIAMMMVMVYNLADTFFLGLTHNDLMVTAVSFATPLFMIFMSLGTLFGVGGTSVISRALGEGKTEYAKKACSFCMWACVAVSVVIGRTVTTRSYSLCSSPEWAKRGEYNITVKRDDAGFVSPYIQDNWKVGQKVTISGPQGHLYYEGLRDAKKVVALAGGSGITPFMGMAYAIRDGLEDFDLTILFGSRTAEGIVYKQELDEVCAQCSKVHVVHVLSDEEREGYEHGFITAELIKKYGGEDEYSIFMCGPQAMYNFLDGEIAKLGLRRKFVRREMFGAIKDPWNQPGYPEEIRGKKFKLSVIKYGQRYEIEASADESLLTAIERAGISAPSRCRSGECGWCRSKLLEGKVFIPEKTDGRRRADLDFGYIHPCSSFPAGDCVIEIADPTM